MSEQEQKQTEDFNEVLEKVEEESSKEVSSDENLQEFKSSHGVDAEIPDAKATKTDEKPDAKGDKMTKVGMITAMMTKLNGMKKDEVDAIAEQTMKVSSSSSEMKSKYPQKNVQEDVKNMIVVCASPYENKRNGCIDEYDVSSIKSPGMNIAEIPGKGGAVAWKDVEVDKFIRRKNAHFARRSKSAEERKAEFDD